MASIDISVIIPSRNNKAEIAEIIKRLSDQTRDIVLEYIITDMNSTDGGVLDFLELVKERELNGCVIQSGGTNVSAALNTGLYKANGRYVTFVFPSRFYKDYFNDYFEAAEKKGAEFIFAQPPSADDGEPVIPEGILGTDIVVRLIKNSVSIDFTAVMLRRDFLIRNKLRFDENCTLGYAEAFIYSVLICNPVIGYADVQLEREKLSGEGGASSPATNNCFDRLDAMVRVSSAAKDLHKDDGVLNDAFRYEKLPSIMMSCVDKLIDEGFNKTSIRNIIKSKGYDDYLSFSSYTSSDLRNKILVWKYLPIVYKP